MADKPRKVVSDEIIIAIKENFSSLNENELDNPKKIEKNSPAAYLATLMDMMTCPITGEPMTDPVITVMGQTHERKVIEQRCKRYNIDLISNYLVKNMIEQLHFLNKALSATMQIDSSEMAEEKEKEKIEKNSPAAYLAALMEMATCPITGEPMTDPVITTMGQTYERKAIETWFEKHNTDPITNEPLKNKTLITNHLVKNMIEKLNLCNEALSANMQINQPEMVEEKEKEKEKTTNTTSVFRQRLFSEPHSDRNLDQGNLPQALIEELGSFLRNV